MNIDDFKLKLEERFGDKITLSDDSVYVNNKTPIKLICKEHGEFSARPDNLMHACGCYKCGRESAKLKISDGPKTFVEKAIKKHGEGTYDYAIAITEYGKGKKVHIKCNKCGNIFEQSPYMHIAGNGCPFCNKFPQKDNTETFKEKLAKLHPNLELIGEYGKDNDDLIYTEKNEKQRPIGLCRKNMDAKNVIMKHIIKRPLKKGLKNFMNGLRIVFTHKK